MLNFGPTKDGVFSDEMIARLHEIAAWSNINKVAITGTQALDSSEKASVPATASGKHRYLFVMPIVSNKLSSKIPSLESTVVIFNTHSTIKGIKLLGKTEEVRYTAEGGVVTIQIPAAIRTTNGDVVDVELN